MTNPPQPSPVQDAAADIIADTMYTDAGVIQATPEDAAQALKDAGFLPDHLPDSDVAHLTLRVTDDGEEWDTCSTLHLMTPTVAAKALSAGIGGLIGSAVRSQAEAGTPLEDMVNTVAVFLGTVHERMLRDTLEALPDDLRTAFLTTAMQHAAGDDQ